MNGTADNTRVLMLRENLEHIPEFAFPTGYSLRWYQPGDEENWLRIHLAADLHNRITPDLFARQFGTDTRLLRERQCYLIDAGGTAIGTATAWFNDDFDGGRIGRVHWVAILPGHQGRGLSKPLMTAVCRRLRELGHDRAYLSTSTRIERAVRLYLRFGFAPWIRNDCEAAAWEDFQGRFGDGLLRRRL
jgi:GNAT superfamily N-acetyltransferase